MSNYKVGDLAALFGSTSKNELQSLFKERNKKQNRQQAKKKNFSQNEEIPTVKVESEKKKNKKASLKVPSKSIPMTDSASHKGFGKNKKRLNEDVSKYASKESTVESFTPPSSKKLKLKNVPPFIRSRKKKESTNTELGNRDAALFVLDDQEKLFNESSQIENISGDRPKKQKRRKELATNSPPSGYEDINKIGTSNEIGKGEIRLKNDKTKEESMKDLSCTLFVGNLPVSVNKKMLHKLFLPFGTIRNVRIRGAIPVKLTIPKKVAAIKSEYHDGLHSLSGFVVYKNRESARKALSLNGTLLDGNHIVVDSAHQIGEKKLYNNELSVFIGNLPFDVDDETVRSTFEECGDIQAIRIIRDKNTGVGKGFGYVQFQNVKSKEKAFTLEDAEIGGRKIRIKPINNSQKKSGSKEHLMMIRNNMASRRRSKESGGKKSVKKLLKKGKRLHQKKRIARLFGENFVK